MSAPAGPVRQFVLNVYFPTKLRGKSETARRLHIVTLNQLERFLHRPAEFSDLNDDTLARWMTWFRERGRTPVTANDYRNRIMAVARLAVLKRCLEDVPTLEPEIEPEKTPKAWMLNELGQILEACSSLTGFIGGIPSGDWWSGLVKISWDTGERIGAIMELRWDWLDLETGWLTVRAEARKGGKKPKSFRLHDDTLDCLRRNKRETESPKIFPWYLHPQMIYHKYRKILEAAGLPTGRDSMFHRLRKTTASYYKAAGGNATELLGHSGEKVTRKYFDPRIVKTPQAADMLPRINSQR